MVTLTHFEIPLNLAKNYGGFKNRKLVNYFVRFAETVFNRYKDKVKYWMTFNEVNNMMDYTNDVFTWTNAGFIVDKNDPKPTETIYTAAHHILLASALAIKKGKEINPDFKIGAMISHIPMYPYSSNPNDVMLAEETMRIRYFFPDVMARGHYPNYIKKEWQKNNFNIPILVNDEDILSRGTVDYIGFSYYMTATVSAAHATKDDSENIHGKIPNQMENPYLKASQWGWTIDPVGLRYVMNRLWDRYELSLFIVENGIGLEETPDKNGHINDVDRINYLKAHIIEMKKAVLDDGVELIGYLPWGIIDLISFTTGEMAKRYGMIYVDLDNRGKGSLKRSKKASFNWYRNVIASNGEVL